MARITIEDCLKRINNRFEIVSIAARRARQLSLGDSEPLVALENDKPTVLALREIADGYTHFESRDETQDVDVDSQALADALAMAGEEADERQDADTNDHDAVEQDAKNPDVSDMAEEVNDSADDAEADAKTADDESEAGVHEEEDIVPGDEGDDVDTAEDDTAAS